MRMMDAGGDTALHKAVRSQHLDVVKLLVKEDPEFEFPPNHAQETPLYLAAESGFHDALINILESCKKPTYAAGPSNRTPLHAAVIQERRDCIRSLWRWNKPLCEEPDLWGWNSLHYAVKLGLEDVVSDMLRWKKSLVYLPAGSENDWTTAIHIAASEGDVNMINKLLYHCPDCWDTLNSNNQNALHVAVLNNQDEAVCFLLDSDKCDNLVVDPDSDGNTPLHLLAASGNHVPELINHPRAKKMSFNKQNQTPLDIALSCTATTKKEKLVEDLFSIGRFGKRDFEVKRKYEYMPNPNAETETGGKMQHKEDDHDKAKKEDQTKVESIMKVAQFHIVVATLIMTVTFAAGITLPGGFESDPDSHNQGMAILTRKTAFRAFVVSDAIAFTFSAGAIFIYFLMAAQSRIPQRKKIVWKFYNLAAICQCLSMFAVVIAFATELQEKATDSQDCQCEILDKTPNPKKYPTLYKAAMRGNIGDANFLLADHLKRDEENGYQVTPKGNTVLHVAALYGHSHFAAEVLRLLRQCHNSKEKLTRMTDASGDTALHRSVRSQHLDVVKLLVKEDSEFELPPNHAQETPLYRATESGFHDALISILESCKKPTYAADCIRSLWRWNKPLCEELDLWGWNSLHYVVKLGLEDIVSAMLRWKKSLVYLPAGSENDWTTAIHIAASEGDVNMINKLLNHCPDCWDMLKSNNQNALHVAVLNNQDKVVCSLLDLDKCDSLVDEPVVMATLLSICLLPLEKLMEDLCSIGRFGKRDFEVKQKYEYMHNPNDETGTGVKMQLNDEMGTGVKMRLREEDHDNANKEDQAEVRTIMKSAQFQIVVATLIITVTFAAGITLPGGFESDPNSHNQGMAILTRKTAFRAFAISDAIAFTCSAVAIFIYFLMADTSRSPQSKKLVLKLYDLAGIFQCLSMLAVVIAFATGMFATLSRSLGLAVTVCFIGCLTILLYVLVFIYIERKRE
ncbi:hypothetical protein P3S68_024906 [Capsicum galapagoense]